MGGTGSVPGLAKESQRSVSSGGSGSKVPGQHLQEAVQWSSHQGTFGQPRDFLGVSDMVGFQGLRFQNLHFHVEAFLKLRCWEPSLSFHNGPPQSLPEERPTPAIPAAPCALPWGGEATKQRDNWRTQPSRQEWGRAGHEKAHPPVCLFQG